MRSSGSEIGKPRRSGPTHQGAVPARGAGQDQGCQTAAAQTVFPGPASPTPTAFPFPVCPALPSLPRTLRSKMGRNSQAARARIAPESASAPPWQRPEPGLGSPSPACAPPPFPPFGSSHPDHLAHPVPVVWFWLRLRLLLGFRLQGRPSPAQGPGRPPGSHPLLPSPPPFAAPAPGCDCRYRCRGRRGGGKDREGCRLVGSGGRFWTTLAREPGRDGGRRRSHPGFLNAFSRRDPGTRRRSAGVRGGERGPCALVSASVVRA